MKEPIYQRIRQLIMHEIENLPANTPILSEREMAEKYDASRMTVRKAVNILEEEGFLYRNGNIGTFVADDNLRKTVREQNIQKIFTDVKNYRLIYFDVKSVDVKMMEWLQINRDDTFIKIVRLNLVDDCAESLEEIYIVRKYVDAKDMHNIESILSYSGNLQNGSIKQEFSAVSVPLQYANLMKIPMDTPVIKVDSIIFTKKGQIYARVASYKHPKNARVEMTF